MQALPVRSLNELSIALNVGFEARGGAQCHGALLETEATNKHLSSIEQPSLEIYLRAHRGAKPCIVTSCRGQL